MEKTFNNLIEKLKSKQEYFRIENTNMFLDLCNKILIEIGLEDNYTIQFPHYAHHLINAASNLENDETTLYFKIEALIQKAKEKLNKHLTVTDDEINQIELLLDQHTQFVNDIKIINNIFSKMPLNKIALKKLKLINKKYYELNFEDEALEFQRINELRQEIEILLKQYNKNTLLNDYFEIVQPTILSNNEKYYFLSPKNLVHESFNYITPLEAGFPKNKPYIKLQENDIILYTQKDHTLITNRVHTKSNKHVITNNVTVIRTSKINTSYLICFFNDYIFEPVLKKNKNSKINILHLKQITLPIVNEDLENYFARKVATYNKNFMEYTKLDNAIKTANEIAEKQGEKGALYYLELEKII